MLRTLLGHAPLRRCFGAPRSLVANPKKLQKNIIVRKSVPFLGKGVKIRRTKTPVEPSDQLLARLCERVMLSITEGSDESNLQNFYLAFVDKLGVDSFRNFVQRHEAKFPTLVHAKRFIEHLKFCSRWFRHDTQLLSLFSACDWRQVSLDAIPKAIDEEEFDSQQRNELRLKSCREAMPVAQTLFNQYSETDEEKTEICFPKPEYIQCIDDIPVSSFSHASDDSSARQERSLADFLKRQEPAAERPVLDCIMVFKEIGSTPRIPTNFIYFQLEHGDDQILTKENVTTSLSLAGISSIMAVHIYNKNLRMANEEPKLEHFLTDIQLQIPPELVSQTKLVNHSETTRADAQLLKKQESLKDEALSGLSTASVDMEKDTNRLKSVFRFSTSVPRRNQTYGFVELKVSEDKDKLLQSNYKLFGLEIEGGLLSIEDADMKCTLRVGNLPWGLNPQHFQLHLNNILRSAGEAVQVLCPEQYNLFYSDASYLFLELSSFTAAYRICRLLNTGIYRGRSLHVEFKRGYSKFVKGSFQENYQSEEQKETERLQIVQRTLKRQQQMEDALLNN